MTMNDHQHAGAGGAQATTPTNTIDTMSDFGDRADYTLLDTLNPDPEQGNHMPNRQRRPISTGHYVKTVPTPLPNPSFIAHSPTLFKELGISEELAQSQEFLEFFSGDLSATSSSSSPCMRNVGWACGYALSIMGQEYYKQDGGFGGNAYGDGRASSIFEGVFDGKKRWEFQLKGSGPTPYCRGADGRAVLRSSIREFLAQEHMHSLGVPTSRSLSLIVSLSEKVSRPWYSENSQSEDPDIMIQEPVAISTRVAPSFLRVGQLELFGRRARKKEHPRALEELEMMVQHAIRREYSDEVPLGPHPVDCVHHHLTHQQILDFAIAFRSRQARLIANWIRVGYTQSNFNSDNNAVGGYTLDYGPFGFVERFDPLFVQWTGGGAHYAFMNQPIPAQKNYESFCSALRPLLEQGEKKESSTTSLEKLDAICQGFKGVVDAEVQGMWARKVGLKKFDPALVNQLLTLMQVTPADYTILFRELSGLPRTVGPQKESNNAERTSAAGEGSEEGEGAAPMSAGTADITKAFYKTDNKHVFGVQPPHPTYETNPVGITEAWQKFLDAWHKELDAQHSPSENQNVGRDNESISQQMKLVNPKYTMREWMLVPAIQQASEFVSAPKISFGVDGGGSSNFSILLELQKVLSDPYAEQSDAMQDKYYRLKPLDTFGAGGVAWCSCSS